MKNRLECVERRYWLINYKNSAQNTQKTTALNRSDDVTKKMMTPEKKLLYQNIPFIIDNLFTKFHDLTTSSSKAILQYFTFKNTHYG